MIILIFITLKKMYKYSMASLTKAEMLSWLKTEDRSELEKLYEKAYAVKLANTGKVVHFRGIIEFSNVCSKNCYYCGIRKDNKNVKRYSMDAKNILKAAKFALEAGYGSVVLQSGERADKMFVALIEKLLKDLNAMSSGKLGITLSLGEQSEATYKKWFAAGAKRYLLRIETSNPGLYAKLHPGDHEFGARLACLKLLKKTGYQVGTGVMIGLPFQTCEDLADDLAFFKKNDIDMLGMGPYIPHAETPLNAYAGNFDKKKNLRLGLTMIALARLSMPDINIAATTALQALDPKGRELGLLAGANIIMPNLTPTEYRAGYKLYDNKPCLDENAEMCLHCLEKRITALDEKIGYNSEGTSKHYLKRTKSGRVLKIPASKIDSKISI
ncbi:MAG: [FeFe] hydrogenase H-cluster radical SAM maturase HydE [Candidatus Firestonebacteria bacterium]